MTELTENIARVRENIARAAESVGRIPGSVRVLAATKTVKPEIINLLSGDGIGLVGENRVQEFVKKADYVKNIEWHFIGSLQTNKFKYLLGRVTLIHSVDRISLADEIQRQSAAAGIVTRVLVEINAAGEPNKSGVKVDGLRFLYDHIKSLSNVELCGFMPVMPVNAKPSLYSEMNDVFNGYKASDSKICELSMGMSGDYETAVRYGATIVRLGSCIFGQRN
jgi:pyridoxal phosphate enzyme (YggS family)